MLRNKKKGFTIVELVIVIAVIGILSAVLIPAFSGLVARANLANDNMVVKNINTQLAAAEITDGKNVTMYDALQDAKEAGYLVANINARSNNQLVWDSTIDRFALVDADGNVLAGEMKATKEYQLWKISNNVDAKYSTYYTGSATTVTTSKGFDAGENDNIVQITYTNNTSAQNVVIRTNSAKTALNINAYVGTPSDVVNHYGEVGVLTINTNGGDSFHEFGDVSYAVVKQGHFVVEDKAVVKVVNKQNATVKVDTAGTGSVEQAYAVAGNETNTGNVTFTTKTSAEIDEIGQTTQMNYANACRIGETYYETLETGLTAALAKTDATLVITRDLDMKNANWAAYKVAAGKTLTIDGQGHTIKNLIISNYISAGSGSGVAGDGNSASYYAGFISANDGTLNMQNINFDSFLVDMKVPSTSTGSSILAVALGNNIGNAVLTDVNVSNSVVKGYGKVAVLHGFTQKGSFVANHCALTNNEVVLEADGTDPEAGMAAIIIGYDGVSKATTNGIKLENNRITIDASVNWPTGVFHTSNDGTVYVEAYNTTWNYTSPTYVKGNNTAENPNSVEFVDYVDGYGYETAEQAAAARA